LRELSLLRLLELTYSSSRKPFITEVLLLMMWEISTAAE